MLQQALLSDSRSPSSKPLAEAVRYLTMFNGGATRSCSIMVLCDATANMGDVWAMAKKDAPQALARIHEFCGADTVRIKWVGFRDYDCGATIASQWFSDPMQLGAFVATVDCRGGEDRPGRAIEEALQHANRDENAPSRIVLIGATAPHKERQGNAISGCGRVLETDYETECKELLAKKIPVFTFQIGNDPDTRRAFTRISELTAGKFGAFSGSLLHAVCLQALEQTGGEDLATQYQKRYMSA
jgi:hypothetical protein